MASIPSAMRAIHRLFETMDGAHGTGAASRVGMASEQCEEAGKPSPEAESLPFSEAQEPLSSSAESLKRTLSAEQLINYSARLLTEAAIDDEDEGEATEDDVDLGIHEEEKESDEEPIVSRASSGARCELLETPLATFSSRLFERPRPARLASPRSPAQTDGLDASAAGLHGSFSRKVAQGGGVSGARMLAAACGTDAGASLGCYAGTRQPSTPPAGVVWSIGMGSPTASTPPPPAASATTVAAAPTVKKMPTAPRTRVVDFVHLPVGADGELAAAASSATFTNGSSVGPAGEGGGSREESQQPDEWSTGQIVRRQAELKFRLGGGGIYNCVKQCLLHNGFQLATTSEADWNIFWGRPLRFAEFGMLDQFQKVNHFPGTHVLGRKDHLARACQRARRLWCEKEMDFLPKTWVLPSDRSELASEIECKEGKQMYIVKPPDGCKGQGIRIYNDPIANTKPTAACVVSRYIPNPMLINGTKFDMRIYVTVTSFQPLRVYVHEQGLVRFCTAAYNPSSKMSNRKNKFSHLTNFAVNRTSDKFVSNKSASEDNFGHKWSLRALRDWMVCAGIDPEPIFLSIDKLIVKTLVAVEVPINTNTALYVPNRNTCFELFGFDVLIDSEHKPWLLEVNTSPSLSCDTPLDTAIKCQVVRDTLQLARVQQYSRTQLDEWLEHDRRQRMQGEKNKRRQLADNTRRREVCSALLSPLMVLTEEDAEILRESEEEFQRRGKFRLVFPCNDALTREVSSLFETRRFHNVLLLHWVMRGNSLTVDDYLNGKHLALKNPDPSFKPPPFSATAVFAAAVTKDAERQKKDNAATAASPLAPRRIHVAAAGDKASEWSASNTRSTYVNSKLSATQAERNGLLGELGRWHRLAPAAHTDAPLSSSAAHTDAPLSSSAAAMQQQSPQMVQGQQLQQHSRASTLLLLQAQSKGSPAERMASASERLVSLSGWDQAVTHGGSKKPSRLPWIERPRSSPVRQPTRTGGDPSVGGAANARSSLALCSREQGGRDGQACSHGNPEHGGHATTLAWSARSLSALRPATAAEEVSEAKGSSSRFADVFDLGTLGDETQLQVDDADKFLFADLLASDFDGAEAGVEECTSQYVATWLHTGCAATGQEPSSGDEDSMGSSKQETDGFGVAGGARRVVSPTSPSSSRPGALAGGGRTHHARILGKNPMTAGASRTTYSLTSAPDTSPSPNGGPRGSSDAASSEVGCGAPIVPPLPVGARGAGSAQDQVFAASCTPSSPREDESLVVTPSGLACASPSSRSSLSDAGTVEHGSTTGANSSSPFPLVRELLGQPAGFPWLERPATNFPARDEMWADGCSPSRRNDALIAPGELRNRFTGPWMHRSGVTRSGASTRAKPAAASVAGGGQVPGGGQVCRLASSVVTMNGIATSRSSATKGADVFLHAALHRHDRDAGLSMSPVADGVAEEVGVMLPLQLSSPQDTGGAPGGESSGANAGGVIFTKARPSTTFADRERQRFGAWSTAVAHSSCSPDVFVVGSAAFADVPPANERGLARRLSRSRGAMRSGELKMSGSDLEVMADHRWDAWNAPPAGIAGISITANGGDGGNSFRNSSVTVCMSPLIMRSLMSAPKDKSAPAPSQATSAKHSPLRRLCVYLFDRKRRYRR